MYELVKDAQGKILECSDCGAFKEIPIAHSFNDQNERTARAMAAVQARKPYEPPTVRHLGAIEPTIARSYGRQGVEHLQAHTGRGKTGNT
jgi:hypothetical protein